MIGVLFPLVVRFSNHERVRRGHAMLPPVSRAAETLCAPGFHCQIRRPRAPEFRLAETALEPRKIACLTL